MNKVEYAAIKAVNWSTLKHMQTSPLMYQWRLTHPEPSKSSYVFGSAVHCAILEPEKFSERFAVYDGVRNGKKWDVWQAEHPGVESLKPDELARVHIVAEAVWSHPAASKLLRGGRCEEIVTWTDEATGLACKGRLDYIRPDLIIDMKSTHDPVPDAFERAAFNYGYGAQLAFYQDGSIASRLIDGRERPYIVAPQTDEPFDVAVFQLKPETLELGRAFYRSLLHRLVECTEANYFPGVTPEVRQLGVPPWAEAKLFNQYDEEF